MLPATLVVTTIAFVGACTVPSSSEGEGSSSSGGVIEECASHAMSMCADSLCRWSVDLDMCLPTYCVDIDDMSLCTQEPGCAWLDAAGQCENICADIVDQAACEAIDRCEWGDPFGGGDTGGTAETGGELTCHEPFT